MCGRSIEATQHMLMTRREYHRLASERSIQEMLCQELALRLRPNVLWWHTPNEGWRPPREAVRLKAAGLLAGVSDLIFLAGGRAYALELKSATGRASVAQRVFLDRAKAAGAETAVCQGYDAAVSQLRRWGLLQDARH